MKSIQQTMEQSREQQPQEQQPQEQQTEQNHMTEDHNTNETNTPTNFKEFWVWLNRKTIAPWVVLVLTAVWSFSHWEASTAAQSVQITELKSDTSSQIKEMKEIIGRDHDELHRDLIERLEDIKKSQQQLDVKVDQHTIDLEHIKDAVTNLSKKR